MDTSRPGFIVVGEKLALGPLRRDLAPTHARWISQLEVRRGLDSLGIATRRARRSGRRKHSCRRVIYCRTSSGRNAQADAVEFTIYDRADSAPVGTAGLSNIVHACGRAD